MSNAIDVNMGKLAVAQAPDHLTTSGVGSCIAICLYSKTHKKGGLAHVMLPARPTEGAEITENDFKYADIAVQVLIAELKKQQVEKAQLIAKVAGGANMFPGIQGRSQKVGEKNIEKIRELLKTHGIPLSAEETGGTSGRSVNFDLSNGIVTIIKTI